MSDQPAPRIVPFDPRYADAFRRLNEAWITRFFTLEDADRAILGDPVGKVIAPGGEILLAVEGAEAVGCCALKPIEGGYELSKPKSASSLASPAAVKRHTSTERQCCAACAPWCTPSEKSPKPETLSGVICIPDAARSWK